MGIDLVNKLVTNATHNFYKENKVNYIQSDAENLPLANESFDIITNLESSHIYPRVEHFFSEVERVLSPGGFFCYADVQISTKQQPQRLEAFIKKKKNLKIILKHDITKLVQEAIYQRLIVNEDALYKNATAFFGYDEQRCAAEFPILVGIMGLTFLPWWKIRFKNAALRHIAKDARKQKPWVGKEYYYYYLIQKADK